jgi:hypothetical protein
MSDQMIDDAWLNPNKEPSEKEVAFDYLKGPDFRVIWADGAIGTITPNGLLHVAPYAERPAIPRRQVFAIEQIDQGVGKLGAEIISKQISRGTIVREMACDIFMSPQTAENLAHWLLIQVAELKKIQGENR